MSIFKRGFDVAFSLTILVLSLPLFLIASVLIKLSSPGAVIFKQERAARGGKVFKLYKLRTMKEAAGPAITSSQDKRITAIGKFLRRAKIDELPQFINVLKADLSVVGPRPEIPEIVRTYNDQQRKILSYRPGITSLASLRFRGEERMLRPDNLLEDYIRKILPLKISCDLEYFKDSSPWTDLVIIAKTIRSVFDVKD